MAPVWIDLDGMGWRVTSLPRIVFVMKIYRGNIFDVHFNSTNQHKRMTLVLCDLNELGWRVTSELPKIFWLYLRREDRYSVGFNGTNQHKPSTNELRWFGAIWATWGGE